MKINLKTELNETQTIMLGVAIILVFIAGILIGIDI
jgi:hypothetical protein